MATTIETVTDTLHFNRPFRLAIGPTRYLIEKPARLLNEREHAVFDDELGGFDSVRVDPTPFQGTLRLFIDDRLSVVTFYRRRDPAAFTIEKSLDGTFTLRLVKEMSDVIHLPDFNDPSA